MLQWRWLPSSRSWLESVAFRSRETGRNRSLDATDRFRSTSTQWGLRADATHILGRHRWRPASCSSLSENAVAREFDSGPASYRLTESYDVRSAQQGAYVQDSWTGVGDRLTLTLGGRLDRFEKTREIRVLPRAALSWGISARTKLLAVFGEYAQYRWDLRAKKAFIFERWRLTLNGEVINLLNRTHNRYTGLDELDTRTGRAFLENDTLFPILPSAGVTVEF